MTLIGSGPAARGRIPALAGAVFAALGIAAATPAAAQFDKYGHYNQNSDAFADICATAAGGSKACGPVALVNSFVYLQNTYPQLDNKLVGPTADDAHAVALALSKLMGCTACDGTDTAKFLDGKKAYLKDKPGKIKSLPFKNPSAAALAKEIKDREDVELYLGFYDANGNALTNGHYVTLYGISDDTLSFVDPGGDSGDTTTGATDEKIKFNFDSTLKQLVLSGYEGLPEGVASAHVNFAFSESPTPEPAAWAMMITGFGLVGLAARRRRAPAAAALRAAS
jgi:hypothetical protein